MAEPGTEPVSDDELLYRRIPVSQNWYRGGRLSPEAFDPRKDETTGISVYRAKYKSLEEAVQGKSKQGYYVAVLRVSDLRQHGIEVMPRPLLGNPGHAELPGLTCDNRLTDASLELKVRLAQLGSQDVKGPFVQTPSQ